MRTVLWSCFRLLTGRVRSSPPPRPPSSHNCRHGEQAKKSVGCLDCKKNLNLLLSHPRRLSPNSDLAIADPSCPTAAADDIESDPASGALAPPIFSCPVRCSHLWRYTRTGTIQVRRRLVAHHVLFSLVTAKKTHDVDDQLLHRSATSSDVHNPKAFLPTAVLVPAPPPTAISQPIDTSS